MRKRCIWCNRVSDDLKEVTVRTVRRKGFGINEEKFNVMPECEKEFLKFSDFMAKNSSVLMTGIGISTLLIILSSVSLFTDSSFMLPAAMIIGLSVAAQGLLIIRYPFVTPQTKSAFGVKTSIKIARFCGAAAAFAGVLIPVLYLLRTE